MNLNDYPLWTAIITPMLESGEVDYESFEQLLKKQEEARNGILVLGSTGESLNLDLDEKKKISAFAAGLNLKVPLMAGVGGVNLKSTLEWVKYIETLNYQSYLMVTPLYAKPGPKGQTAWFKTLMDHVTKPCMLYNIPGRTGVSLPLETVRELKDHPRFWAIKEASGSTKDFADYVKACGDAPVYSGDDAMLPSYVPLGGKGLVSVASNVWPKETNRYTQLALAQNLKEIDMWKECSNALFCVSNPIPAKRLLTEVGQIKSSVLRSPLDSKELENADNLLVANQKIKDWFQNIN